MKIFHLITSLDNGGAENHLASLTQEQVKKNKIFIIYLKGNDYWKNKLSKKGIKVFKLKLNSLLNLLNLIYVIFKIKNLVEFHKPNIVHSHLSSMEIISVLVKIISQHNFKLIITKHLDSFFLEASNGQNNNMIRGIFIDKFILNKCDKVICISKQIKKYFSKKIKLKKNQYKVIYYGLGINSLRDKTLKNKKSIYRKKFFKNFFYICCIARHVKQKSLDFLIHSFYEFNKKNYKSRLVLVGSGPETQNLEKLSKKLGVYNKILWIKYEENIFQILNKSHVFVLPSKYEGFGLVLLEAMYAKIPIIACKVSAIPEVIKHNWNGLLIKHGSIKDFNKKLKIVRDGKKNLIFIKNSQKTLNIKFNFKKMINRTSKIYNEV